MRKTLLAIHNSVVKNDMTTVRRITTLILGYAIFYMDIKIGPKKVHLSESIPDVSIHEMLTIFSAHVSFDEGFRGVHASNRTWATYILPPYVIALLLSPDQPIEPIEAPFRKILQNTELDEEPTVTQWDALYQSILHEIEKSPIWDLFTSKSVAEFLTTLFKLGIDAFEPRLNLSTGLIYPEADRLTNLNSYDTRLFLEKLTLADIFTSEPIAGITCCPSCHGFKVASRLACPKCGGTALKAVPVPSASDSSTGKQTISDNNHENYFSCQSCIHITQKPLVSLVCTECTTQFEPNSTEYHTINRLVLNKDVAKNLIKSIEKKT